MALSLDELIAHPQTAPAATPAAGTDTTVGTDTGGARPTLDELIKNPRAGKTGAGIPTSFTPQPRDEDSGSFALPQQKNPDVQAVQDWATRERALKLRVWDDIAVQFGDSFAKLPTSQKQSVLLQAFSRYGRAELAQDPLNMPQAQSLGELARSAMDIENIGEKVPFLGGIVTAAKKVGDIYLRKSLGREYRLKQGIGTPEDEDAMIQGLKTSDKAQQGGTFAADVGSTIANSALWASEIGAGAGATKFLKTPEAAAATIKAFKAVPTVANGVKAIGTNLAAMTVMGMRRAATIDAPKVLAATIDDATGVLTGGTNPDEAGTVVSSRSKDSFFKDLGENLLNQWVQQASEESSNLIDLGGIGAARVLKRLIGGKVPDAVKAALGAKLVKALAGTSAMKFLRKAYLAGTNIGQEWIAVGSTLGEIGEERIADLMNWTLEQTGLVDLGAPGRDPLIPPMKQQGLELVAFGLSVPLTKLVGGGMAHGANAVGRMKLAPKPAPADQDAIEAAAIAGGTPVVVKAGIPHDMLTGKDLRTLPGEVAEVTGDQSSVIGGEKAGPAATMPAEPVPPPQLGPRSMGRGISPAAVQAEADKALFDLYGNGGSMDNPEWFRDTFMPSVTPDQIMDAADVADHPLVKERLLDMAIEKGNVEDAQLRQMMGGTGPSKGELRRQRQAQQKEKQAKRQQGIPMAGEAAGEGTQVTKGTAGTEAGARPEAAGPAEQATPEAVFEAAHAAATSPLNNKPEPTEDQRKAGNYTKGHVTVQGMDISIENPAGSTRSGKTREGKPWSTTMTHHYGYIKGTVGKDKDHVDAFINTENPESDTVFVVNQVDPGTGKFDEHKAMLGFNSSEEADQAYHANYQAGWKGMQSITPMTVDEFKKWARSNEPKKGAVTNAGTVQGDQAVHAETGNSDAGGEKPGGGDLRRQGQDQGIPTPAGTAAAEVKPTAEQEWIDQQTEDVRRRNNAHAQRYLEANDTDGYHRFNRRAANEFKDLETKLRAQYRSKKEWEEAGGAPTDKTVNDFAVGDKVVWTRAKHADLRGKTGVVSRINKSRKIVVITLADGKGYDAEPGRIDKEPGLEKPPVTEDSTAKNAESAKKEAKPAVSPQLAAIKKRAAESKGHIIVGTVAKPETAEPREIGKNRDGVTIYEKPDGVRQIVSDGMRKTEPVRLSPQGYIVPTNEERFNRGRTEFLTTEELAGFTKETTPAQSAQQPRNTRAAAEEKPAGQGSLALGYVQPPMPLSLEERLRAVERRYQNKFGDDALDMLNEGARKLDDRDFIDLAGRILAGKYEVPETKRDVLDLQEQWAEDVVAERQKDFEERAKALVPKLLAIEQKGGKVAFGDVPEDDDLAKQAIDNALAFAIGGENDTKVRAKLKNIDKAYALDWGPVKDGMQSLTIELEPNPEEEEDFSPEQAIKLIADTPVRIRAVDLDRLKDDTGANWTQVRGWLLLRNDLAPDVKQWLVTDLRGREQEKPTKETKPPAEKEEANTGAAFKKGDRVVISKSMNEEFNGRHGTISNVTTMVMETLFGGKREYSTYYDVRTDNGADSTTHRAEDLTVETEKPAETVPDIVVNGMFYSPEHMKRTVDIGRLQEQRLRARSARARKPENKRELSQEADKVRRDTDLEWGALANWTKEHPEAAKAAGVIRTDKTDGTDTGGGQRTGPAAVASDKFPIIEAYNDKKQKPVWVVTPTERADAGTFTNWKTMAVRNTGYYSSYRGGRAVPGFQFDSVAKAQAFVTEVTGGKGTEQTEERKPEAPAAETPSWHDDYEIRQDPDERSYIYTKAKPELTLRARRFDNRQDAEHNAEWLYNDKHGIRQGSTPKTEPVVPRSWETTLEGVIKSDSIRNAAENSPHNLKTEARLQITKAWGQYVSSMAGHLGKPGYQDVTDFVDKIDKNLPKYIDNWTEYITDSAAADAGKRKPAKEGMSPEVEEFTRDNGADWNNADNLKGQLSDLHHDWDKEISKLNGGKKPLLGEDDVRKAEKAIADIEERIKQLSTPAAAAEDPRLKMDAELSEALGELFGAATQQHFAMTPEVQAEQVDAILKAGTKVARVLMKRGVYEFAEFARFIKSKAGDAWETVKPYLRNIWNNAADTAGADMQAKVKDVSRSEAESALADLDKSEEPQYNGNGKEENDNRASNSRTGMVGPAGLAEGERSETAPEAPADGTTAPASGRNDETGARTGRGRGENGRGPGGNQAGGESGAGAVRGAGEPGPAVAGGAGTAQGVRESGGRGTREPALNFVITPDTDLAPSGATGKLNANLAAIRTLKKIEKAERTATPAEQRTLAKYAGWGAVSQVFNRRLGKLMLEEGYDRDLNWEKKWGEAYRELSELLTPEEWDAAARSTLNSHFTARNVVTSIWDMVRRLGFRGGRILEPAAGSGNFIGLMPADMASGTQTVAVEMDILTGRILKQLYPQAQTYIAPFQDVDIPENSIDVAVTNVPFLKTGPNSKGRYPTLNLHNYFFAKMIDCVKPGGLVVAITSMHTMESQAAQREYLGSKAELVAAIRLPNNAFRANAGTDVTTDILIFRKPDTEIRQQSSEEQWQNIVAAKTATGEETSINEYFDRHPEMLLGEIGFGELYSDPNNPAGSRDKALLPRKDADLDQLLAAAAAALPENVMGSRIAADIDFSQVHNIKGEGEREHTLVVRNGVIYFIEDGKAVLAENQFPKLSAQAVKDRAPDYFALRDHYLSHIALMRSEEATPEEVEASIARLNRLYDDYVEKHGPLHGGKTRVFEPDNLYDSIVSVERETREVPAGQTNSVRVYKKMPIFFKRIMYPEMIPTSAKDAGDAIRISLGYRGTLDLPYIASLLNIGVPEAERHLQSSELTFRDPETGLWQLREKYLSGNVRQKLSRARAIAAENGEYDKNVKALESVQPKDATPATMNARLGSTWIPPEIISRFATETFGGRINVDYSPAADRWSVGGTAGDSAANFGTRRRNVVSLLESTLNMSPIVVIDTFRIGKEKHTEINQAETVAARAAAERISGAFKSWVAGNPEQANSLAAIFNEKVNNYVEMKVDGAHLVLPGSSDAISLRPHQKNAVWRIITSARAMLAHAVGAGKTYVLIAAAMELRRLGLARKPLILAHNATLRQFAASFKAMYPTANVLVASKRDLDAQHRRQFMGRIVAGDWDAVVMPHSSFSLLPHDPNEESAMLGEMIDQLRTAIHEVAAANGKDDPSVKRLEQQLLKFNTRISDLNQRRGARQANDSLYFQELGFDALFLDEAHGFKKPPFVTKIGRMVGLGTESSQKATDLTLAIRSITKKTGGRNIVFATGTPITNTLGEAYHMLKYLAPDILRSVGADTFDRFIGTFAEVAPIIEMDAAGRFKMKTGLARFVNGDQLASIIRSVFDVVTPTHMREMFLELGVKLPEIQGGRPEIKDLDTTPGMQSITRSIAAALDAYAKLHGADKKLYSFIPVLTYTLARTAALDVRLVDPKAKDEPGNKINTAVREILDIYKEKASDKGTQIVFCDAQHPASLIALQAFLHSQGMPRLEVEDQDKAAAEEAEEAEPIMVYEDIRNKLIAGGIPREEIALISENDTDAKREKLFAEFNEGIVRVLIGGTDKIGVGVNIQQRAYAAHLLDIPWRPDQTEQRIGRIVRQDNMWPMVRVISYGMKGTLDAAIMSKNLRKSIAIHQALSGKLGREFEDPHSDQIMSYQEQMAHFSGNPLALRKVEVDTKVRTLMLEKEVWTNGMDSTRWSLSRARSELKTFTASVEDNTKLLDKIEAALSAGPVVLTIGGRNYEGPKAAAAFDAVVSGRTADILKAVESGDIPSQWDASSKRHFAFLPPALQNIHIAGPHFKIDLNATAMRPTKNDPWSVDWETAIKLAGEVDGLVRFRGFKGNTILQHIENQPDRIRGELVPLKNGIAYNQAAIPRYEAELALPWFREQELTDALIEQEKINAGLFGTDGPEKFDRGLFSDEEIEGRAPTRTVIAAKLKKVTDRIEMLRQERLTIEDTSGFWKPHKRRGKDEDEWRENWDSMRYNLPLDIRRSPKLASTVEEAQRLVYLDSEIQTFELRQADLQRRLELYDNARMSLALENPEEFAKVPSGRTPTQRAGIYYRRGTPAGAARMSPAVLRAKLAPVLDLFWNGVPVEVYAGETGMPANVAAKIRADDMAGKWAGLIYEGTVYINSNMHGDVRSAIGTVMHEMVVHYGLQAMLGKKDFERFINQAWYNGAIRARAKQLMGRYDMTRSQAVEEALADMAESGAPNRMIDRIIAFIQGLLRKAGIAFRDAPTKAEIRQVLAAARRYVETGERGTGLALLLPEQGPAARTGREQAAASYRAIAPTWFSKLQAELSSLKQATMTPQQMEAMLTKAGVKREEMDWTRMGDFFKGRKMVTRKEALDWAKENSITVEEVVKGDYESYINAKEALREAWYKQYGDEIQDNALGKLSKGDESVFPAEPSDVLLKATKKLQDAFAGMPLEAKYNEPQFTNYQLPGGENYRELLLTLPPTKDAESEARRIVGEQAWARMPQSTRDDLIASKTNPSLKDTFTSSHWDEPNVLAHIRFNERSTSADGTSYTPPQKTLFIEEIQSDWHQQGREKGYLTFNRTIQDWLDNRPGSDGTIKAEDMRVEDLERWGAPKNVIQAANNLREKITAVPDAPFKDTSKGWGKLAMKRMIRWAAENGFDRVAWTTGEQQAERYDLSKKVDYIEWEKRHDGMVKLNAVAQGHSISRDVGMDDWMPITEVHNYIGKELEKKIAEVPIKDGTAGVVGKFEGEDLKVGGEGMKAFYDTILPQIANDLGKRYGAKAGTTKIEGLDDKQQIIIRRDSNGMYLTPGNGWSKNIDDSMLFYDYQGAEKWVNKFQKEYPDVVISTHPDAFRPNTVHAMDIPAEMKNDVLFKGQPMYSRGKTGTGGTDRDVIRELVRLGISEQDAADIADGKTPALAVVDKMLGLRYRPGGAIDNADTIIVEENPDGSRSIGFGPDAGPAAMTPHNVGQMSHYDAILMAREQALADINDILENADDNESRYSRSANSAIDSAYLAAVARGDMETAQRLVDEAAAAAGFTQKAFHGSPDGEFAEFKPTPDGIFFTNKERVAQGYTYHRGIWLSPGRNPKIFPVYLNLGKNREIDAMGSRYNNIRFPGHQWKPTVFGNLPKDSVAVREAAAKTLAEGYDSLTIKDVMDAVDHTDKTRSTVYVVRNPSQIKSADPVTRDDQGRVIPLSERFNQASSDIRYSRGPAGSVFKIDDEVLTDAMEAYKNAGGLRRGFDNELIHTYRERVRPFLIRLNHFARINNADYMTTGKLNPEQAEKFIAGIDRDIQTIIREDSAQAIADQMRIVREREDKATRDIARLTRYHEAQKRNMGGLEEAGFKRGKMAGQMRGWEKGVKKGVEIGRSIEKERGRLVSVEYSVDKAFKMLAQEQGVRELDWISNAAREMLVLTNAIRSMDQKQTDAEYERWLRRLFGNRYFEHILRSARYQVKDVYNYVQDELWDRMRATYSKHIETLRQTYWSPTPVEPLKLKRLTSDEDGTGPQQDMRDWLANLKKKNGKFDPGQYSPAELQAVYEKAMGILAEDRLNRETVFNRKRMLAETAGGILTEEITKNNDEMMQKPAMSTPRDRGLVKEWGMDSTAGMKQMAKTAFGGEKTLGYDMFYSQLQEADNLADGMWMQAHKAIDAAHDEEKIGMMQRWQWNNQPKLIKVGGEDQYWTDAEKMGLAALWSRWEARMKIMNNGFIRKELSGSGRSVKGESPAETEGMIEDIIATLTPAQRRIVDRAVRIVTDFAADANRVSMALYGIRRFTEDSYWPMEIEREDVAYIDPEMRDRNALAKSLEGMSFNKDTVWHSKPLRVVSLYDTFDDHVQFMSRYAHVTLPARNIVNIINTIPAVRNALNTRVGREWLGRLRDTILSLAGLESAPIRKELQVVNRLTGNVAKAILGFNPFPALMNRWGGSIAYLPEIGKRSGKALAVFAGRTTLPVILGMPEAKADLEYLMDHGYLGKRWYRDMAEVFIPVKAERTGHTKTAIASIILRKSQQVGLSLMKHAEQRNAIAAFRAFLAAGYSREAARDAVAEITRATQNSSSALEDSPFINAVRRSGAGGIFPFMSQTVVAKNMVVDVFQDISTARRRTGKVPEELIRRLAAVLAAVLASSILLQQVMGWFRRKLTNTQKYGTAGAVIGDVIRDLISSTVPVMRIATDAWSGFGGSMIFDRPIQNLVAGTRKVVGNLADGKDITWKQAEKPVTGLLQVSGVPIGGAAFGLKVLKAQYPSDPRESTRPDTKKVTLGIPAW